MPAMYKRVSAQNWRMGMPCRTLDSSVKAHCGEYATTSSASSGGRRVHTPDGCSSSCSIRCISPLNDGGPTGCSWP